MGGGSTTLVVKVVYTVQGVALGCKLFILSICHTVCSCMASGKDGVRKVVLGFIAAIAPFVSTSRGRKVA